MAVVETATAGGPAAAADALEACFTRLVWQRIDVGNGGPRAVVMGVRHRRPSTVTISLAVAAELRARGLPTLVRGGGG